MNSMARYLNTLRGGVRSTLRSFLSQERRTELKRLQGAARKRFAPALLAIHGSFGANELIAEMERRLPRDFEILMVHSAFDGLLPMYKGSAKDLVGALIDFCGPQRTLVMPSFVMGGRAHDATEYFRSRPFDVRRTPSEMGLVSEVFRRTPNVWRSLHPTCCVCALGPLAKEITAGHHRSRTGMSPDSPYGIMTRRRTAIFGIGIEYYRCLTHAHTAGHKMGSEYPIQFADHSTTVALIDYDGSRYDYELGLPDRSRKLDLRILWSVLTEDELVEWKFHGVRMFVVPEAGVLTRRLVDAARLGITIYGKVRVPVNGVATTTDPRHRISKRGEVA